MTKEDMLWELTVGYNSHENGVAERVNQILMNKIRSILADSDLPQILWPELLDTAVYLKLRISTKHLKRIISFKQLFNQKPDLSHLRVIESQA